MDTRFAGNGIQSFPVGRTRLAGWVMLLNVGPFQKFSLTDALWHIYSLGTQVRAHREGVEQVGQSAGVYLAGLSTAGSAVQACGVGIVCAAATGRRLQGRHHGCLRRI